MSRRGRYVAIATALAVIVVAAGFAYLRGGSTPVSVEGAVRQFRAGSHAATIAAPRASAPRRRPARSVTESAARTSSARPAEPRAIATGRRLPAEGVYVYSTVGSDDVDVLGGSRHEYPAQTTITIRHAGCGFVERWDVLKERWDERESCRTKAGDDLRRLTSYHEFFRHGDTREFRCTGFTYPAGDEPGTSWTVRCVTDTTTTVTQLRAVAWEDMLVAGQRVRTLHVHASSRLTGEQLGTSERDVWGATVSGLVVRERARIDSDSTQPVFGKTHYHESYDIRLQSLEPRR